MLSEKEKTILAILVAKETISDAEEELLEKGYNLNIAYKAVANLQKKASRWMTGVNQIHGWRRKSKPYFGLLEKRLKFHS